MTTEIIITTEELEAGTVATIATSETEKYTLTKVYFIKAYAGEVESTAGTKHSYEAVYVRDGKPVRK